MSEAVLRCVDELIAQMRAGSQEGFPRATAALGNRARAGGPAALTAVVEALAPHLPTLGGAFAKVAVLAGACVEWGGSPVALARVLPARTAMAMRMFATVPAIWAEEVPDRLLPGPDEIAMDEMVRVGEAFAARKGADPELTQAIVFSWCDAEDWLEAAITVLARRDFRDAASAQDLLDLREAAEEIVELAELPEEFGLSGIVRRAGRVQRLASVLDDERLIVLDHVSGRGFALTMSGIGDNFQLHTLLADRLIGSRVRRLLPGERPTRAWVDAATRGNPRTVSGEPVLRRFRLFDGHGGYVAPEGVPADIRPLDGVRVLVLHPPRGSFGWVNGRVFEQMEPSLTLDRRLSRQEAVQWFGRVASARETDLMAPNDALSRE